MRHAFSFACLATLTLILSSCKPDRVDDIQRDPDPISTNQTKLLSRYIELDTTPNSVDTVYDGKFTYDANNRIIKEKQEATNSFNEIETIYSYTGNSITPFKMFETFYYQETTASNNVSYDYINETTSYLTYNNLNQLIKDSSVIDVFKIINGVKNLDRTEKNLNTYQYTNDEISSFNSAGTLNSTYKYQKTMDNKNILSFYISASGLGVYDEKQDYIYDDKINPYKSLVNNAAIYTWIFPDYSLENYSFNNVIKSVRRNRNTNAIVESYDVKYNYNAANYPISSTISRFTTGSISNQNNFNKQLFFYY